MCEIDVNQEIPSSSATISADGDSVNAAIEAGNDEERERENRNTDMENEELKSSVDKFGARQFMYSDSDIRFFTGLPDYNTFLAIYNFCETKTRVRLELL